MMAYDDPSSFQRGNARTGVCSTEGIDGYKGGRGDSIRNELVGGRQDLLKESAFSAHVLVLQEHAALASPWG